MEESVHFKKRKSQTVNKRDHIIKVHNQFLKQLICWSMPFFSDEQLFDFSTSCAMKYQRPCTADNQQHLKKPKLTSPVYTNYQHGFDTEMSDEARAMRKIFLWINTAIASKQMHSQYPVCGNWRQWNCHISSVFIVQLQTEMSRQRIPECWEKSCSWSASL